MRIPSLSRLPSLELTPPFPAILISPWCDLTHSFPSILENTETDIPRTSISPLFLVAMLIRSPFAAPYGFGVFKPSTLWPPPPPEFRHRAAQSTTVEGLKAAASKYQNGSSSPKRNGSGEQHAHHFANLTTHNKAHELADAVERLPESDPKKAEKHVGNGGGNGPDDKLGSSKQKGSTQGGQNKAEVAEVIKVKVDGEEMELEDQIQLYATNEQVRCFLSLPLDLS